MGGSEGKREVLSREDYLQDVLTAYDFLLQQKSVDKEKIGVIGASFGGYMGAILTAKRNVRWLVLRAPANYRDEGFNLPQERYADNEERLLWRHEKLNYQDTLSLHAVHEFPNELLLIESEMDDLVPHQTLENYRNAFPNKSKLTDVVMKGADHSIKDPENRQKYARILIDWFGNKI